MSLQGGFLPDDCKVCTTKPVAVDFMSQRGEAHIRSDRANMCRASISGDGEKRPAQSVVTRVKLCEQMQHDE